MHTGSRLKLLLLIACSFVLILICLFIGKGYDLSHPGELQIFLSLRVSRILLAFMVGAILSLAGLSFQTIFQNSLASPYTLGVASGASLGAAAVIKSGMTSGGSEFIPVMIGAFTGALLSVFFILTVSGMAGGGRNFIMLLSGVALNFMCSSMVMFLQYIGDLAYSFRLNRWIMGSLDSIDFLPVLQLSPFFIAIISLMLYYYRELDIMIFGSDLAFTRGVEIKKIETVFFITVSVATGSVIAVCGPIGFVGLMVPHILKMMFDVRHLHLAVGCIFGGGAFLVICDTVSRSIVTHGQVPVGIITSFTGAPFFIYLLMKKKSY